MTMRRVFSRFVNLIEISNLYLLSANFASLGLAVLNFKLLASYLSVESLAIYALIITFQGFSTLILTGPLRVGLVRLYAKALVRNQQSEYIGFAFIVILGAGLCAVVIGSVISVFFSFKTPISIMGVTFAIAYGMLLDYNSFLSGAALQRGKKGLAAVRIIIGKLSLTVGLFIVAAMGKVIDVVSILGWTVAAFVMILILMQFMQGNASVEQLEVKNSKWRNWASELVSFSWIFMVIGIISWAQTGLPRFFLSWWQSPESIARFFIVTQIALISMLGAMATVTQIISPRLFRRQEERPHEVLSPWQNEILSGAGAVLFVALLGAGFSLIIGDRLIQLLTQRNYNDLGFLLALMFVTYGLYSTAQILRIYGDQIKKPRIYLIANLLYPISAVLLAFIGSKINLQTLCFYVLMGEVIHIALIVGINQFYFIRNRGSDL